MADEKEFLDAIQANRDDEASRLVYADWLEENNEIERAEFLRLEAQLERIQPRVEELRGRLDKEWLAIVARTVDLVLIGARPNLINTIKAVRTVTGWGLKEAKDFAELADTRPVALQEGISRRDAEVHAKQFADIPGVRIEIGAYAVIYAQWKRRQKP